MSIASITKFRCTHCQHVFELAAKDLQRCPNCFWTTSLISLNQEGESAQPSSQSFRQPASESTHQKKKNSNSTWIRLVARVFVIGSILALLAGVCVWAYPRVGSWVQSGKIDSVLKSRSFASLPIFSHKEKLVEPKQQEKTAGVQKKEKASNPTVLSGEDQALLAKPFPISGQPKLSSEEEQALQAKSDRVNLGSEKALLPFWGKQDFENLLQNEMKNRKIELGWGYERALVKTFERHYLPAKEAYDASNYELARTQLLESLNFPIYQNNPIRYRAIVLVMLRPFINDVIGKVAMLNQRLLAAQFVTEANAIFDEYDSLSQLLKSGAWVNAQEKIQHLKNRIQTFENKPAAESIGYPPSLSKIDLELQAAIRLESAPKLDALANWNPLLIDLDHKEKIVQRNLPDSLKKMTDLFAQAIALVESGQLEEARLKFRAVEFPSELVEEARKRVEILDRALAEKVKGNQN